MILCFIIKSAILGGLFYKFCGQLQLTASSRFRSGVPSIHPNCRQLVKAINNLIRLYELVINSVDIQLDENILGMINETYMSPLQEVDFSQVQGMRSRKPDAYCLYVRT